MTRDARPRPSDETRRTRGRPALPTNDVQGQSPFQALLARGPDPDFFAFLLFCVFAFLRFCFFAFLLFSFFLLFANNRNLRRLFYYNNLNKIHHSIHHSHSTTCMPSCHHAIMPSCHHVLHIYMRIIYYTTC